VRAKFRYAELTSRWRASEGRFFFAHFRLSGSASFFQIHKIWKEVEFYMYFSPASLFETEPGSRSERQRAISLNPANFAYPERVQHRLPAGQI
jgi:hypothetical protein